MQTVNIGILAHVDAGKTSLTERLLFDTGVIDQLGSVDAGTTQTDTGDIERQRGITIRSAVASFVVGERLVNLIDTPGHSDFVAEVERALTVLDGVVLVISAVESVQPHTRTLMKTLRSLRMPTLIFINKIDRRGARADGVLADIRRLLTPSVAPMGTVRGIGTPEAQFHGYGTSQAIAPVLAEHDDVLLGKLVDDVTPSDEELMATLRAQVASADVCPVLFGSALTGAGVSALLDAIGLLLPPSPPPESGLRARVFAIARLGGGEKVAYVRSYGGEMSKRQRVTVYRREPDGRIASYRAQVTGLDLTSPHRPGPETLGAGHIAKVRGLSGVRIGDQIGSVEALQEQAFFAPPSLETAVRPRSGVTPEALHKALVSLADEDPLIHTRVTPAGETSVLLYGEVQKEVIAATLADVYGVEAQFAPSQIMHLERPVRAGRAVEFLGNGFLATVGLRVEPVDEPSGVSYRVGIEYGVLPLTFHRAIEETVRKSLEQGVYGWPVTDVRVTLTHSGFKPDTTAPDFREVTPLVLMQALAMAGTRVYEPCHRFEVETPEDRLGAVTAYLAHLGARIDSTLDGRVCGELPARLVPDFRRRLPNLSNGEGLWSSVVAGDRRVAGRPPRRSRTDGNPFDRAEYTRFLAQRNLADQRR